LKQKGTLEVAKAKAASVKGAARERVAQTPGGQIAAAIKGQSGPGEADMLMPESSGSLTFGDNSLSSANSREVDPESEIAAFRDRDKPPQDKQA
jgi:type IV secretion system protein TrbL